MKREQADLENRLWSDRLAILKAHEEKVKVAKTRCAFQPQSQAPRRSLLIPLSYLERR